MGSKFSSTSLPCPDKIECICQSFKITDDSKKGIVAAIEELRALCPAIGIILIPDQIWSSHREFLLQENDDAQHCSIIDGTLRLKQLHKLTIPLHRFALKNGGTRPDFQYKDDLPEKWVFQTDNSDKRHAIYKRYVGKLQELTFAEWLISKEWRIKDLAAWGAASDIVAYKIDNLTSYFECKYFGVEDSLFKSIVDSLNNRQGDSSLSLYDMRNYFIFRAYEAAMQLREESGQKIIVLIVSALMWHSADLILLRDEWIDWRVPEIDETYSSQDWTNLITRNRVRYPKFDSEYQQAIGQVDQIWIIRESSAFDYVLEKRVILGKGE